MNNLDIRQEWKKAGLSMWQIAEKYGYTDCTFSKKLRKEFSQEEKNKVRSIILQLVNEKNATALNVDVTEILED